MIISNVTYGFDKILSGIRIRSFYNSGASAQIIGGGLNYNFVSMKFVAHSNWIYVFNEFFTEVITTTIPTTTTIGSTSPIPDVEVQRWGIINDQSTLLSK